LVPIWITFGKSLDSAWAEDTTTVDFIMSRQDDSMTRVYSALSSPIRREIVDILRTRGKAGFKELHENVKTSVGALYHHLDALEGIVSQGTDKKYVLTEEGKAAIDALSITEERIATVIAPSGMRETRLGLVTKEALFGRSIFQYLSQDSLRSLPIAILIVVLGGWLSYQTNLEPLLLFYMNPSSGFNRAWLALLFPAGWITTFVIADLLSVAVFKRKGGDLTLLTTTAFAMLPLLIVPGTFALAKVLSVPIATESMLIVLLPIILQVWVICLLSSAVSVSKGLKMERTAVVSLGVIYVNILALVALLELGFF
jgi:DNA-binding transcriptional ArsR family regulator